MTNILKLLTPDLKFWIICAVLKEIYGNTNYWNPKLRHVSCQYMAILSEEAGNQ